MTSERSINLASWEAKVMASLHAGGTMLLSRPIRFDCSGRIRRGSRCWHRDDPESVNGSPWRVGDVLLCRETWNVMLPNRKEWPVEKQAECAIYRATHTRPDECLWRSAATMPRWAVRLKPTVLSVRAGRIAEMSPEDAERHGVDSVGVLVEGVEYACNANSDYVLALQQCWERRWGKCYPWASSPWAWTMEVQRGND